MEDQQSQGREQLLTIHRRRLHELERQAAFRGSNTPPEILLEIQDIKAKIREFDLSIAEAAPSPLSQASLPSNPSRRQLRAVLVRSFDLTGLRSLCFEVQEEIRERLAVDLQINLEILGGDDKESIVLNLIEYLEHRNYLNYLVAAIQRARPGML